MITLTELSRWTFCYACFCYWWRSRLKCQDNLQSGRLVWFWSPFNWQPADKYSQYALACSRLSGIGDNAWMKGARNIKGGGVGSFLSYYFRVRTFSVSRTQLSRSLEQGKRGWYFWNEREINWRIREYSRLSLNWHLGKTDARSWSLPFFTLFIWLSIRGTSLLDGYLVP